VAEWIAEYFNSATPLPMLLFPVAGWHTSACPHAGSIQGCATDRENLLFRKDFRGDAAVSSFVNLSLGGADSSVATSAHVPTFLCFASECGPLVNARSLYALSE